MIIDLPKFLSHEAHKYMFYGFIRSFRLNFPGVSVQNAIENFLKYHKVYNGIMDSGNFDSESARNLYYRMDSQFMELYKAEK